MGLFVDDAELQFARAISALMYCNPFLPERIAHERTALGDQFTETSAVWSSRPGDGNELRNVINLQKKVEERCHIIRDRLAGGVKTVGTHLALYQDMVLYLLYYRAEPALDLLITNSANRQRAGGYAEFRTTWKLFFDIPNSDPLEPQDPASVYALLFQIRRAFFHIFSHVIGGSLPTAHLRAAIWQSIFTHDLSRHRRGLYRHMNDIPVLITGPSGTGKELVARAIALSSHIPFDAKSQSFAADFSQSFLPLNLSALSPTLIESELFGHRRGAFTGAIEDRKGWLETCTPQGTVFLDEIGELEGQIQVKLLRVLQDRIFHRLGESTPRHFAGKLIAATNRDLAAEMQHGRFRSDLYYRLCADMITTPSLQQQLTDSPEELFSLILFIARRIAGEHAEALAQEAHAWVTTQLGKSYPWRGNFRELEQCVRNIMIRREYHPHKAPIASEAEQLSAGILSAQFSAEELLQRYCALIHKQTGSYEETARRLKIDRRTVKTKIDAHREFTARTV